MLFLVCLIVCFCLDFEQNEIENFTFNSILHNVADSHMIALTDQSLSFFFVVGFYFIVC